MRLGIDLGAAATRFCVASGLLGAESGSWSRLNHRLWEEPSWLSLRFGPGGPYGGGAPKIAGGSAAFDLAGSVEGLEEVRRGQSIVWPRFPRHAGTDPESFKQGFLLYWDVVLRKAMDAHRRCDRVCLTMPWYRERLLAQTLNRLELPVPLHSIPDFYATYIAGGPLRSDSERLLFVDWGVDAAQLVRFTTWGEGAERWVHVEEASDVPELGTQFADGLSENGHGEGGGLEADLASWVELENASAREEVGEDRAGRRVAGEKLTRRILSALLRARNSGQPVDRVLFLGDPRFLPEAIEGHALDRMPLSAPARGAAVFCNPKTAPVHFSLAGGLYLVVNRDRPRPLVSMTQCLQGGSDGASFGLEFPRGAEETTELRLLWGPFPGLGPYHLVATLRHRLDSPSLTGFGGCMVHRVGMNLFGSLWLLDPTMDSQPSVSWQLKLDEWAFWTAP